jgi:hypothetical protein
MLEVKYILLSLDYFHVDQLSLSSTIISNYIIHRIGI